MCESGKLLGGGGIKPTAEDSEGILLPPQVNSEGGVFLAEGTSCEKGLQPSYPGAPNK